ncbi:hypothetical protein JCM10908_006505 [Rhodotorula pacifica]|uniref:uncharacterized protein n=1 Tax=Rhodotorula pacifica TaxID=1495444 RepID=UPI00317901F2
MLGKLPTELLLIIAELAAPTLPGARHSLASLRPLIWTEVQLDKDGVEPFSRTIEQDALVAKFVKTLVCSDITQAALATLWKLLPRFQNLTRLAIIDAYDETAPLQLFMLERLPNLQHLVLEDVLVNKRLPKLVRLETLCLKNTVRVHRPLGQAIPITPDGILSSHSKSAKKLLRLVDHNFDNWLEDGVDKDYCVAALNQVDVVHLDDSSLECTLHTLGGLCRTVTTRTVFRTNMHDVCEFLLLAPLAILPPNLNVWIEANHRRDDHEPLCLLHASRILADKVRAHSIVPTSMTFPLRWGLGVPKQEMLCARTAIYSLLQALLQHNIAVRFHNEPPPGDIPWGKTSHEHGGSQNGEGYFADLIDGQCTEPGLRDCKIIMVD